MVETLTKTITSSITNTKLVVAIVAAFLAGGAAFAAAGVTSAPTASVCLASSQLVFDATHSANVPGTVFDSISVKMSYQQLKNYVSSGYNLKLVKMGAAGGGSGYEFLNCGMVQIADGDNVFSCFGNPWQNGDSVQYSKISLRFDADGAISYIPAENENVGEISVKIWASR